MTSPTSVQEIADFYDHKTRTVLRRYGPGPRVHYRTGFVDELDSSANIADLRKQLVASQERVLYPAAEFWPMRPLPFGDVLYADWALGRAAPSSGRRSSALM